MWGATYNAPYYVPTVEFQSTLPVWGATYPEEADAEVWQFQSTLPVWGATLATAAISAAVAVFQSTLPVWGATRIVLSALSTNPISIHAPRVGSDRCLQPTDTFFLYFNPRSPCGERHRRLMHRKGDRIYFNPRSPCGERHHFPTALYQTRKISIHAPRVGSDAAALEKYKEEHISIHAPRVGSDCFNRFRPRMPLRFQSTLPVWGATVSKLDTTETPVHFNPRSPCGERPGVIRRERERRYFNPRSPCGERQLRPAGAGAGGNFNPRSPCGERHGSMPHGSPLENFNPRSPCGERPNATAHAQQHQKFQSTLPVWGATSV